MIFDLPWRRKPAPPRHSSWELRLLAAQTLQLFDDLRIGDFRALRMIAELVDQAGPEAAAQALAEKGIVP